MSAAAAATEIPEGIPAPKRGKKKLILIGVVVLLVLAILGGGAAWWLKKRAAHAAELATEEEGGGGKAVAEHKIDASHPPTFLPLDPFVVNLADQDADRYAQIGITLELESPAFAEQMKGYMPAIRNAILMVIAHKSARAARALGQGRAGRRDHARGRAADGHRDRGAGAGQRAGRGGGRRGRGRSAGGVAGHGQRRLGFRCIGVGIGLGTGTRRWPRHPLQPSPRPRCTSRPPLRRPHADKPKAHGDAAASPIHHVHFSSFIIQ